MKTGVYRYAKTLFKPTRPQQVDQILKEYGKMKVPYFFQFAKDKREKQCEMYSESVVNRISKAIENPKNMFKPIKNLGKLNYLMLIKDMQDEYNNHDVNSVFDRWNRKYGNNVKLNEDSDNQKNNLLEIANMVKADLHKIELDDQKIINSLVSFLYKKESTRKKKLLWYVYGEELYTNIIENLSKSNLGDLNICYKCGARVEDLVDCKCDNCRKLEAKELRGNKILKCVDCGAEFEVGVKSRVKCRCDDCQRIYRREYKAKKQAEYRLLENVDKSN